MAHATNDLQAIQQTAGVGGLNIGGFSFNWRDCHFRHGLYDQLEINIDLFNPDALYGDPYKLVWYNATSNLSQSTRSIFMT